MNRRAVLIAGGSAAVAAAALGGFSLAEVGGMEAYDESAAASRASLSATPDLIELIGQATLAANSHNTQPWRFRIREGRIDILPDLGQRTPAVDPADHHLFISLGCAAENLVLAGASRGQQISATFSDEDGGLIACEVAAGAAVASELAAAIPFRQSTRAVYDGSALDEAVLSELAAAAQEPGVELALISARSGIDRLRDLIVAANDRQMVDPAFLSELKSWIRFNPKQALAHRDGLFSACTGSPQLPGWMAGTMFDWFVTAAAESQRYRRQVDSSAGIAVFFAEHDDPEHWVRVGRAFERFALKATSLEIRTAHLNQPVEVTAFRSELAGLAGKPGGLPFLVVRFGRGPIMPYSLRRPVTDVLA